MFPRYIPGCRQHCLVPARSCFCKKLRWPYASCLCYCAVLQRMTRTSISCRTPTVAACRMLHRGGITTCQMHQTKQLRKQPPLQWPMPRMADPGPSICRRKLSVVIFTMQTFRPFLQAMSLETIALKAAAMHEKTSLSISTTYKYDNKFRHVLMHQAGQLLTNEPSLLTRPGLYSKQQLQV